MIVLSFKSKKDKEHLLEKARKMEAYVSEIVDCLEEAKHEGYGEELYHERHHLDDPEYREYHERRGVSRGRYGYRGM